MSKEIQIESNAKSDNRIAKLVLGIVFDAIGMLSYVIPGAAEFIDIVWAPIGAILLAKMYKGTVGKIGGIVEFLEEIIPHELGHHASEINKNRKPKPRGKYVEEIAEKYKVQINEKYNEVIKDLTRK